MTGVKACLPLPTCARFRNENVCKSETDGVPVVAQWLTNPTRDHEVADLIPGLVQWVEDPALP